MTRSSKTVRRSVFISYSHHDARQLEKLRIALAPFEEDGLEVWDDRRIRPGNRWEAEIDEALAKARVGVLLVSQRFLASSFIQRKEMPAILRRHRADGLTVIWVLLESCAWQRTWLKGVQAAINVSKPLTALHGEPLAKELKRIADYVVAASDAPIGQGTLPKGTLEAAHNSQADGAPSVRALRDIFVKNVFAIKEENPLRDRRMAEIFAREQARPRTKSRVVVSLLARTGFNYLHPRGRNFSAGFGRLLDDDTHRIQVMLEYPNSVHVDARMRAAKAMGASEMEAKANVAMDWLNDIPQAKNLKIKFTVNPVYCSLFMTPELVVYDPYHLGTLGHEGPSGNEFLVFEFERPARPGPRARDYHALFKAYFDFLWTDEIGLRSVANVRKYRGASEPVVARLSKRSRRDDASAT